MGAPSQDPLSSCQGLSNYHILKRNCCLASMIVIAEETWMVGNCTLESLSKRRALPAILWKNEDLTG
jgi:hypothetical protein